MCQWSPRALAVYGCIVEWRASEIRGGRWLLESFRSSASFRTIL